MVCAQTTLQRSISKKNLVQCMSMEKDQLVSVSYLKQVINDDRSYVPSGPKLSEMDYVREMHRSMFALSPNGDHPECYRHYEALALGTIPTTALDPVLYRHLEFGLVNSR